jgi:hypothetical protein
MDSVRDIVSGPNAEVHHTLYAGHGALQSIEFRFHVAEEAPPFYNVVYI